MNVLVAGGSGFIGRVCCRVLAERGHAVTAGSRSPDPSALPEDVETARLDVTEDVAGTVDGHDAVVNLVALPSHIEPRGQDHDAVHRQGTERLVRASEAADVSRFVQMSGLGVDTDIQTEYFTAKRAAEGIVRESTLEWVIYRPSVVFGEGAAFISFLRRLTAARVVPLPGGGTMRIQPMWVGDLAPMLADGVTGDKHAGEAYELCGPDVLTLAETVTLLQPNAIVVPVPMGVAAVGATVAEFVPGIPLSRDQYRVQRLENTVEDNDVAAFGVESRDLTSLAEYLDQTYEPQ